jgi:hypothetical protein
VLDEPNGSSVEGAARMQTLADQLEQAARQELTEQLG